MGGDRKADALQLIRSTRSRNHPDRHKPAVAAAWPAAFLVAALLPACAPPDPAPTSGARQLDPLAGTWRAVLESPGGELPFTLRITGIETAGDAAVPAVAINDNEEVPFTTVSRDGARVILRIDGYDSEINCRLSDDGATLTGEWSKTIPGGRSSLPFQARRGDARRFSDTPPDAAALADGGALPSVNGAWSVEFTDEDGTQPARAEFRQEGERVTGTFLTPTGDYRYLEGDYRDGFLRLSAFDGGHVFLFHARARANGTLSGDFWSRDTYHATWTAHRPAAVGTEPVLPDPFSIVKLTNEAGRLRFTFPDLDGRPVSLSDPRFQGKVVLVNLFGSWCPNCNDEAPLLATWHRRYRDRGLEIIGLAYEFTGEAARDSEFMRRYGRRYGLEFPLLLAGISDKKAAGETLPDLTSVQAYPTNIFIGRNGRVRGIHSGFSGPATGTHYTEMIARFEALFEELLDEPAPAAD